MPQPTGLQFTARIANLPEDTFAVTEFTLHEQLSAPFTLTLRLASTFSGIDVAEVLDQPATLTIFQDGEPQRQVQGIVYGFERGETGHHRTAYALTVVPALERLDLMQNSRIFQQQDSQEIIQTLLTERGATGTVFNLRRQPEEREYGVQHRESDLALLTRLAAEEGWHYRFDATTDGQPLVMADHHRDAPALPDALYNATTGGSHRQACVLGFRHRQQVAVARTALQDYTFKNPGYALIHDEQASHRTHRADYEHYDYPGRFKRDESGQPFTRARLDSLRNDANVADGESNRADFTAGARVNLTDHPHTAHNRDWLITGVTHTGKQPQAMEEEGGSGATTYHNDFQAIPGDQTWRPRIEDSQRPRMDGPQMAMVTGPDGEEIHCDEHGRVKVRFPWDRYSSNDEHSSAWLRVSQGWAGSGYGFMAIPRIGDEVIVDFLAGDPDQPLIIGRTYHAGNRPPEDLPEHKTRTTLKTRTHKGEGSNELRFEDEAGQQQVYFHAQRDLDLLTENDRTEVIRNNSHLTVSNDQTHHIKGHAHTTVDGEKRETVGKDSHQVIGGTIHQKAGTAILSEAGSEVHHRAGNKVVLDAGAELTIAAGGSFLKLDASGVTMGGPSIKINSGGAPGSGSGQGAQAARLPQTLTKHTGEKVAPPELADVGQRADAGANPQGRRIQTRVQPASQGSGAAAAQGAPSATAESASAVASGVTGASSSGAKDTAQTDDKPEIKTLTLLPLRYGRVQQEPAGHEPGLPSTLTSRPVGYRVLRNGYLYILDADAGALSEYTHQDGKLSGTLEYPKGHTLYVGFSEVSWTARKKAQVMDNSDEREAFLQRVDLPTTVPSSGGRFMPTIEQAGQWVAECAESSTPEDYHWEHHPYFNNTGIGALQGQYGIGNPEESLALVVRDDIGIMLDLANHQDTLVDEIEAWASTGQTERDYTLGTWIESMTLLSEQGLSDSLDGLTDPASRLMSRDLDALPEPAQARTREALLDALNEDRISNPPNPDDPHLPPGLEAELAPLRRQMNDGRFYTTQIKMLEVTKVWSLRQALKGADPAFVDKHIATLRALESQSRAQMRRVLQGEGFGDRGINELIDRPRMDAFMAEQREKLAAWHEQLDQITDDRVTLVSDARFHEAAWYFDATDSTQVDAALTVEYACFKDLCRNDEAAEAILGWLDNHPEYSRPLFYTRPQSEQASDSALMTTYAFLLKGGYDLVTQAKQKARQLAESETASGHVLDLQQASETIQSKAAAVGDTLSPALSLGIASAMEKLHKGVERQQMPELDELFRNLPKFFKGRMLDAVQNGQVEFRLSSEAELDAFRQNLDQTLGLNGQLSQLSKDHEIAKANSGHKSAKARQLNDRFHATRKEQEQFARRLAAAISPIEEGDTGLKLSPAETGRAGITLVLPGDQRQHVGRWMSHFRDGLKTAPTANVIGDQVGLLVFVAQAVNLHRVMGETFGSNATLNSYKPLIESALATSAAGFMSAQGMADTALKARAKALTSVWQASALDALHVQMGKLHVRLGGLAYFAGVFTSTISTYNHYGRFLDASVRGNQKAQIGAVMAMSGSGGLAATNAYGVYRTAGALKSVVQAGSFAAKKSAWAVAGRGLSSVFARLNVFGAIFTVAELAGTWIHNHYNLDKRNKWLLSTPWSLEPNKNTDRSLEQYAAAMSWMGGSVSLEPASAGDGPRQLTLNCHSLPPDALNLPLSGDPHCRLSISAWSIQPPYRDMFGGAPETWVRATYPILTSLAFNEDADHLQLSFREPEHEKTDHKRLTESLALAVKLETRQPGGDYQSEEYLLHVNADSASPATFMYEKPKDERVIWRVVRQPTILLDVFE